MRTYDLFDYLIANRLLFTKNFIKKVRKSSVDTSYTPSNLQYISKLKCRAYRASFD